MKRIRILFILLLVFDLGRYAFANDEMGTKYVNSIDGVVLRDGPSVNSIKLTVINYSTPVTVLQETEKEDQIGKVKGRWVKVKFSPIVFDYATRNRKEKVYTGWVFSGFLTDRATVSLNTREILNVVNGCYKINKSNFPKDFRSGRFETCEITYEPNDCVGFNLYSDHSTMYFTSEYTSSNGHWEINNNSIKATIGHNEYYDQESVDLCIIDKCSNSLINELEYCKSRCRHQYLPLKIFLGKDGKVYYKFGNEKESK
ncbi:SH3 domain-containing protein, partial [Leptospira stimsonii]|uniref:SH3 domain-containing protein n=1 Tax=Leptospira stimsonii TaxID=2202203 RepID=UPI001083E203